MNVSTHQPGSMQAYLSGGGTSFVGVGVVRSSVRSLAFQPDPAVMRRRPTVSRPVLPPPLPPRVSPRMVRPARRLAAFLLTLSRTNTYEGRDARFIADDLTCGFVKDALFLDMGGLKVALRELAEMGFVSPADNGGLRIDNLDGLEQFCD